jgi:hypothetical protein
MWLLGFLAFLRFSSVFTSFKTRRRRLTITPATSSTWRVYAQVRPVGQRTWKNVPVLTSSGDTTFEINTIGKPGDVYQDTLLGQPLRSHDFALTELKNGKKYEYRFGLPVSGAVPDPSNEKGMDDGTRHLPGSRCRERADLSAR